MDFSVMSSPEAPQPAGAKRTFAADGRTNEDKAAANPKGMVIDAIGKTRAFAKGLIKATL
jgi:hypothetical protein